jgi:hypothetical protein
MRPSALILLISNPNGEGAQMDRGQSSIRDCAEKPVTRLDVDSEDSNETANLVEESL